MLCLVEDIRGEKMAYKVAPLPGSFMLTGIVGFVISMNMLSTYPSWAFSFMLVFTLMVVSSLISMAKAPVGSYDLEKEKIL